MQIKNGQSIYDIAIQESGSIETVFELALHNGLGITETLTAGNELEIPGTTSGVSKVVSYLSARGVKPASDLTETDIVNTIADEGVEFWGIEIDFVVS